MAYSATRLGCGLICIGVLAVGGCSRAPSRIHPPSINASSAGAAAMTQYDTNGDGAVASEELAQAPSLQAALQNLDQNQDGRVTADEVQARVEAWQESKLGITSAQCQVMLDGVPLEGALVTFEPEAFLGDEVKPALGTTDAQGMAILTIAEEHRQDPAVTGAHCGLYKVRVTKQQNGQELIPARYNTETTFGIEIAHDSVSRDATPVFELTSK